MNNVWRIVVCIARLHNYCINERLGNQAFTVYEEGLLAMAAIWEFSESISKEYPQWSWNRERLVNQVASKGLKCPATNNISKWK